MHIRTFIKYRELEISKSRNFGNYIKLIGQLRERTTHKRSEAAKDLNEGSISMGKYFRFLFTRIYIFKNAHIHITF